MKKTFVLLSVLCLGLAFAGSAAAATAPAELTLDLFVTEGTVCHQNAAATAPAAAVNGAEAVAAELFANELAAGGGGGGVQQCGDVVCRKPTYCCNASCSWCVPEGMSCIQIACN